MSKKFTYCPFCNDGWIYHSDEKQMYKMDCHCGYMYKHTDWDKDVDNLICKWNEQAKDLIVMPWHKLYTECNYPREECEGQMFLIVMSKQFETDLPFIGVARFTNNLFRLDECEFNEFKDSRPAFYANSEYGPFEIRATHWCPLPQLPKELISKDEFYRTDETAFNN